MQTLNLTDQATAVQGRPDPALSVEDITFSYKLGSEQLAVVERFSFTVNQGEFVAVLGPSGCGKSTLLELICGLLKPDSGSIKAPAAALQSQSDALLPWRTALANAALPLEVAGVKRAEAQRQITPLFERFGLSGCEQLLPQQLSGGMRQRVAFIRTLAMQRPLLALDEPFAALDALTRDQLRSWLKHSLELEPRTTVLVTHDIEEAVLLADRVIVLSNRPVRVVEDIPIQLENRRFDNPKVGGLIAELRDLLVPTQPVAVTAQ